MGLDATIYCDCYERRELNTQPRPEWKVYVSEDGCRETTATDLETQLAFDRWNLEQACEHDNGCLLHHYIGNISRVGMLRKIIGEQAEKFPLILGKVIHNGVHCGDSLSLEEVKAIKPEVEELSQIHLNSSQDECRLRNFEAQMRELVECALLVRRPLTF